MRKPGKIVRNNLYIHKDYIDHWDIPDWLYITRALRMDGKDMPGMDILKYDMTLQHTSVISCFNFDGHAEPAIQMVWTDLRQLWYRNDTGPIYHHKWMMVGDDYQGFDVEESKERSKLILKIFHEHPEIRKNKIGNQSYWYENVVPLMID